LLYIAGVFSNAASLAVPDLQRSNDFRIQPSIVHIVSNTAYINSYIEMVCKSRAKVVASKTSQI